MHIETSKDLAKKLRTILETLERQKLPGFADFIKSNSKARDSLMSKFDGIERGLRDTDEILFDQSMNGFKNVCWAVNQSIAEKHRKLLPPEEWDLRYIRFMKIKFIKFGCELGEFYLVPYTPRVRPRSPHWFTVDEMIDMIDNPLTVSTILAFSGLPVRPEALKGPGPGEKHMIVDFTSGKMEVKYELGKMR